MVTDHFALSINYLGLESSSSRDVKLSGHDKGQQTHSGQEKEGLASLRNVHRKQG